MAVSAVYSVRLFVQQGVSGSVTAFTVLAGEVVVVRSIDCYVGAPDFSTTLLFKDAVQSAAFLTFTAELGQSRSFTWTGRQVFEPSDGLELVADGHPWDVRISGYRLGLTP